MLSAIALVGGLSAAPAAATPVTTATLTGRIIMPVGLTVPTGFGGLVALSVDEVDGVRTTVKSARIAADGTFTMSGLVPGEHRILFSGTYINTIPMYHDEAFRYADTEPLELVAGDNTLLDVQLYRGATLEGFVLGRDGGDVGPGAVRVVSAPSAYAETGASRIVSFNDATDRYIATKLPPGDYVIEFYLGGNNPGWYGAFSGSARQLVDAVPVTVGFEGRVTDAHILLDRTPGITGTYTAVRHPSVTGPEPNEITARPFPGTTVGTTRRVNLEDQGEFRVPGLEPGVYQLCTSAGGSIDTDPAGRTCHGQSPENPDGLPIVVGEGTTTGAEITVVMPGSIWVQGLVYPDPEDPSGFTSPNYVVAKFWRFDEARRGWVMQRESSRIGGGDDVESYRALPPGEYRIEVIYHDLADTYYREYWPGGVTRFVDAEIVTLLQGEQKVLSGMTLRPDGIARTRLAGADRFATAVALSASEFADDSRPTVFIANGLNYPDALAAGPAAAALGGPLLLVTPTTIPSVVKAELERLRPREIIVVGGPSTVSGAVEQQLQRYVDDPGLVIRLAGPDRFATSRSIVEEVFGDSPGSVVFVATGRNYPDALAAGAAASAYGGPVLLVDGAANRLDAATRALLDKLNPSFIVIAGGPSAVSAGIESHLAERYSVGNSFVVRLAGSDRYQTAQEINDNLFGEIDSVYIANGLGFADALAAGPIAGMTGSPLYLAPPSCVPSGVITTMTYYGARNYVVVGGPSVLSDRVLAGRTC